MGYAPRITSTAEKEIIPKRELELVRFAQCAMRIAGLSREMSSTTTTTTTTVTMPGGRGKGRGRGRGEVIEKEKAEVGGLGGIGNRVANLRRPSNAQNTSKLYTCRDVIDYKALKKQGVMLNLLAFDGMV